MLNRFSVYGIARCSGGSFVLLCLVVFFAIAAGAQ